MSPEHPRDLALGKGCPTPLGSHLSGNGINFALPSEHATAVTLCLFQPGNATPFAELHFDPEKNKTDHIWHIHIAKLPDNTHYAYKVDGPKGEEHRFDPKILLIDPFAHVLNSPHIWGTQKDQILAVAPTPSSFDWEGDSSPNTPMHQSVIYEMHVRGFTKDSSSGVKHAGTFLGIIEKIPHLQKLGVTAIELLPIFSFDETANSFTDPETNTPLFNYWGYSTYHFFYPMACYGTEANRVIDECKEMVKALHKAGIEVILDVVYNHTADAPNVRSFRGIDNATYYLLSDHGHDTNYTGCGNTIQCNHPEVIEFILSSLRYWVTEMHIDGFRFDLASIFCRGRNGEVLETPPIVEAISNDPTLAKTKLIAEPWDCGGLYQAGTFPGKMRWAEWNGHFRDVVRRFIKGTDGQAGLFATVMCGSSAYFTKGKAPYQSINFITAHDGFTLRDLVTYNDKHNHENGENNRDGVDNNESWNCGKEGESKNRALLALRERQMRNFVFALCLSIGTPMILMGDEYSHTRDGNNNPYSLDKKKNYFLWDTLEENSDFFTFFTSLLKFRREHPLFLRETFLHDEDVHWHGHRPGAPTWGPASRFVAYTLIDREHNRNLYIAFNAHFAPASITLPDAGVKKHWVRLIDTSLPHPDGIEPNGPHLDVRYTLPPFSTILLEAQQ